MKTENAPTESPILWELAERHAQAELEPTEPPLAGEFARLSGLMHKHPKFIERREVSGEQLEVTPSVRFISLVKSPQGSTEHSNKTTEARSVTLLDDDADIPGSLIAQAHRIEGSNELYLTLGSHDKTSFRQYTVHDGHLADIADSHEELTDAEIATVKDAFGAMSEKIEANFEATDRKRISRKIGAWWNDTDGKRAKRYADRQTRREIRRNSLGEVGTDV